ncbi:MAG: hypothetical protein R6U57_08355 [Anaerolineales bacterium]
MNSINRGRIHLSVDIEATAGDEVLAELGRLYTHEHVLVYDTQKQKLFRLSDLSNSRLKSLLKRSGKRLDESPLRNFIKQLSSSLFLRHKRNVEWFDTQRIPPDTAAIHGYFQPNLFKGILENPFMSVLLREPLERTIAQYVEWKRSKGKVRWRIDIPYQPNTTFREFAFRNELKNFQFKSLGDKRLGDFDLIGVAECLDGFIMQLHGEEPRRNGIQPTQGRIQQSKYKKLGITEDLIEEFKEYNRKDYDLYYLAKEFIGYCE